MDRCSQREELSRQRRRRQPVFASYAIAPSPMDLRFWPGAVVMMLIATLTASLVSSSGRTAWFSGVLVLAVYLIFAITLYLLPSKPA